MNRRGVYRRKRPRGKFSGGIPVFRIAFRGCVEAKPVGVVHLAVPAKASENGLAELPDKTVATVLPSTGVREYVPGNLAQSDRIPGTATSQRRK